MTEYEMMALYDKMVKEKDKEIERLKDELETITFTAKIKQEAIDSLIKKQDKAIEELKQAYTNIENNNNTNYIHIAFRDDLLNILQGEDNE